MNCGRGMVLCARHVHGQLRGVDMNVRREKRDMGHTQVRYERPNQLRHRAEQLLEQGTAIIGKMSADEITRLIEELHASQGELLRQNEELSRIQAELEESRDKLSDIYDFVPVGYFTFDQDYLITDANHTATELLGVDRDVLVARAFTDFVAPGFEEIFVHNCARSVETRTSQTCPLKLVKDNGCEFYAQLDSLVVRDDKNGRRRIRISVTDVTERRRVIAEVTRLAAIVESSDDAIIGKDLDNRITSWNRAAERIYGYSADQVRGKSISILLPSDDPGRVAILLEKLGRGERVDHFETVHMTRDGRRRHISLTISPIQDVEGNIVGASTIARDITDRKKAEERLRKSEEHYRMVTETINDGLGQFDGNGIPVYVNEKYGEIFGYSRDEILGRHWREIFDRDAQEIMEAQLIARRKGHAEPYEFSTTRKDGRRIHVRVSPQPMFDDSGGFKGSLAVVTDLTERKWMEDALRESEDKMRSILNASPDAILQVGMDLKILWANKAALELNSDILVSSCCDAYQTCMSLDGQCVCKKVIESGQIETNSLCFPVAEGSGGEICWENIGVPLRNSHGRINGAILIARNITERKMAERAMLEYQQKLRSQASQLSLAEERQRRRIATDIHDNVIQGLALSMIKLDLLRESSDLAGNTLFGEVTQTLSQAIDDMRNMTFDISSPTLYKLGLSVAVDELADDLICRQHSIEYEFYDDQQEKPLDDDVRVLLFQSIRELFVNLIKHAEAHKVSICIERIGQSVCTTVSDDGVGFDVDHTDLTMHRTGGFGLFNIRERLDYIGGSMEIQSLPGQGSTFVLIAPLKNTLQGNKSP